MRMLDAPPDRVFEVWTSAEHVQSRWGPDGDANVAKYNSIEGGNQTLDRLSAYVASL